MMAIILLQLISPLRVDEENGPQKFFRVIYLTSSFIKAFIIYLTFLKALGGPEREDEQCSEAATLGDFDDLGSLASLSSINERLQEVRRN